LIESFLPLWLTAILLKFSHALSSAVDGGSLLKCGYAVAEALYIWHPAEI